MLAARGGHASARLMRWLGWPNLVKAREARRRNYEERIWRGEVSPRRARYLEARGVKVGEGLRPENRIIRSVLTVPIWVPDHRL